MANNPTSQILSLIQGSQFKDSRANEVLNLMAGALNEIWGEIFPVSITSGSSSGGSVSVSNVANFQYEIFSTNVRFSWDGQGSGILYEIRTGNDWATANHVVTTASLSANIDPISIPLTYGSHEFLIKAIGVSGTYSATATSVIVFVPEITPPVVSAKLISNFVLLTWTDPGSLFAIDKYDLLRNGTVIGTVVKGNFHSFFEVVGGNNAYQVVPYDIVGNVGTPSTAIQLLVSNPTDFILEDSATSILDGTITNGVVEGEKLLVPIFDAQTYEDHFIDNTFSTPQDQIDAGYPIYIQPAETTAEYQEVFDFGATFNNIIINIDWNYSAVSGNVTISTDIEYSTDAITWSTPVTGTSLFADTARYVRITVTFTPDDDTCLLYFYNFRCLLNVKRENDGGFGTADAADPSGTAVVFNKDFLSVDSITITPISNVTITPVYNYSFTPGDDTFYVYLLDLAGARVSGDFTWAARGIL